MALYVVSLDSKLVVIVDGQLVRIEMMSRVPWQRWSARVVFGKGARNGTYLTVSTWRTVLVAGK